MSPSSPTFETRSLTLAAYLSLQGFDRTCEKVTETHGGKLKPYGVWRFEESSDLLKKVQLFGAEEASVEPTKFHNKMAELRREVMELVG